VWGSSCITEDLLKFILIERGIRWTRFIVYTFKSRCFLSLWVRRISYLFYLILLVGGVRFHWTFTLCFGWYRYCCRDHHICFTEWIWLLITSTLTCLIVAHSLSWVVICHLLKLYLRLMILSWYRSGISSIN